MLYLKLSQIVAILVFKAAVLTFFSLYTAVINGFTVSTTTSQEIWTYDSSAEYKKVK
jgi:hypothetical protein